MRGTLASLVCGLIFGFGLMISGMTQPTKILGFLDIFGAWDPSLAVVMAAALVVTGLGFALARRRPAPVIAPQCLWPTKTAIDRPLVIGAVLFGLGWGLVGLCPGPALENPRPSARALSSSRRRHGPRHGFCRTCGASAVPAPEKILAAFPPPGAQKKRRAFQKLAFGTARLTALGGAQHSGNPLGPCALGLWGAGRRPRPPKGPQRERVIVFQAPVGRASASPSRFRPSFTLARGW